MSAASNHATLTGPTGPGWIFSAVFGLPVLAVAVVAVVLNWGR